MKLTPSQRNAISKVKFLFWDGIPDILVVVDEEDWIESRNIEMGKETNTTTLTQLQKTKRAKQAVKSAKKAEKMAKKGPKKSKDVGPDGEGQGQATTKAAMKSSQGIKYHLPGLLQVQVGYQYHTLDFFRPGWKGQDDGRKQMTEWLERKHWVRTREPFETWLTADGKVEVVHLEAEWDVDNNMREIGSVGSGWRHHTDWRKNYMGTSVGR
jgi:hypothetical protein